MSTSQEHSSHKAADNEEPEPGAEESVPLDGRDQEGERLIDELGRHLSERDARGSLKANEESPNGKQARPKPD